LNQRPIITLTTDFGYQDGFTGAMKGVILSMNPAVQFVDVSHGVPRQDLFAGAMVVRGACPYFPPHAIHLIVIDPGVGTSRKAMIAVTDRGRYVLPDNGLLTLLERFTPIREAWSIENPDFCLPTISNTFHGRDIFAPTAAHLSLGRPPEHAGPAITNWQRLEIPQCRKVDKGWEGQVIYGDLYGNLFCNFEIEAMKELKPDCVLRFEGGEVRGLKAAYGDVASGEALLTFGSSGFLEIAINGGDARQQFGLQPGDGVMLSPN